MQVSQSVLQLRRAFGLPPPPPPPPPHLVSFMVGARVAWRGAAVAFFAAGVAFFAAAFSFPLVFSATAFSSSMAIASFTENASSAASSLHTLKKFAANVEAIKYQLPQYGLAADRSKVEVEYFTSPPGHADVLVLMQVPMRT